MNLRRLRDALGQPIKARTYYRAWTSFSASRYQVIQRAEAYARRVTAATRASACGEVRMDGRAGAREKRSMPRSLGTFHFVRELET